MAEQSAALEQTADETAQLKAAMAERDEEILRLRDLLITRDHELGALKGRIAMIDQASRRLGEAAARIPIPGATRILQMLIRFVQRAVQ
jgi:septal ring factor EnvC (AmiA/AmiB activator)